MGRWRRRRDAVGEDDHTAGRERRVDRAES